MSLTVRVEQMLTDAGLVTFFDEHPAQWHSVANRAHTFVESLFPDGATIRRDDVAQTMVPVLEVNEDLRTYLQSKKLTQKYWFRYFADLIVDRAWEGIQQG